ncbi:MAG: UTP--glucose-1-phosphate uridylyltransferase [Candidatus Berkelbacteria bacterium]
MSKIRKAVIPAAGYGTRFLPAVKTIPKEMLPVVDKPTILYVVEELVKSGIEEIIIVTNPHKHEIEDFFDDDAEMENFLEKNGKLEILDQIRKISRMAEFVYIRQKGNYGNGTPVLNAEAVVGNEPFVVHWADEIDLANPPTITQMSEVYAKYERPVIAAFRVANDREYSQYGILDGKDIGGGVHELKGIVEKPGPENPPSNLAQRGAFILTPDIFPALKETVPGNDNEIWLVDGMNAIVKNGPLYGCEVKGCKSYDTGNPLNYLKTNIEFALMRDDLRDDLKDYLKSLDI